MSSPPQPADLPTWLQLETLANNGRYLSPWKREHVPSLRAQPLSALDDIPLQLFGELPKELTSFAHRLPVLQATVPSIRRHGREPTQVGSCFPTSSLRTVATDALDWCWNIKLHLPNDVRDRIKKSMGSKEIRPIDAMMGPVFSTLLSLVDSTSPFLGIVEEPVGVVARLTTAEGEDMEMGALYRKLPHLDLIPGFALYSSPGRPLSKAPILAAQLTEGPDAEDRFFALFVEPVLDVFFSLAAQGVTLQMHSQNLLFEFTPDRQSTRRVWVRDLGGTNYAADYRAERGLPDILQQATSHTPGADAARLDEWFTRDGQRRRMFDERLLFGHAYDTQLSAFLYQLLLGMWRAGVFRRRDLGGLADAIGSRAQAAAAHYGFDLHHLRPNLPPRQSFGMSLLRGIAQHPPFRPRGV